MTKDLEPGDMITWRKWDKSLRCTVDDIGILIKMDYNVMIIFTIDGERHVHMSRIVRVDRRPRVHAGGDS